MTTRALLVILPPTLACACADTTFDAEGTLLPEIRTVIEVSWEPLGGGQAWVEFGPDEGYGKATPPVPDGGGRSEALLLGNKPFEQVHWRVVAEQDGRLVVGPDHHTWTQGLPAAMPDFSLEHDEGCNRGWVLGVSWAEQTYLYALDPDAEVVWYQELPIGTVTLAVDPVPGQAAVRYLRVGMDHALDSSVILTQGMDGQEQDSVEAEQGHHSFAARSDGTLAWLAIDVQDHKDYGPMVGDRVLERDAATGEVRQLYSTWDHLEYDPATTLDTNFYPQGVDWTHANTLAWAPDRGSYWLTMGGVNDLVEVDGTSGEVLTVVGADGYPVDPPADGFGAGYGPHGGGWTPDGTLLLFDNNDTDSARSSRVLEYEIDDEAGLAREVWRHEGPDGVLAMVMGGADRLDDGRTFVHWGNSGYLSVVGADGEECWAAQQTSIVADATWVADLYGRTEAAD